MNKLNILIVDDEPSARKKIKTFLREFEEVNEVTEAENGIEAVNVIKSSSPDLLFLDIQMPGMNGFEVIEAIGVDEMPNVIFVTAYDSYAIDAFEVNAIDYLLKPFDIERFQKSFNKALKQINSGNENKGNIKAIEKLIQNVNKNEEPVNRFMVSKGSRYFFITANEIYYISSAEKYVELHTEKDIYLVRDTMQNLEDKLDGSNFTRIHRSYIVNIDHIKEMQPWSHGEYVIILKNGSKIKLSRRYRENLFDRFK